MIKVKSAKFKNYGRLSELQCQFYDGVTRLVGMNGSGKSTIIDSVIACVSGIALKKGGIIGERYRYIGKNSKSSDIEYEFVDESRGATFFIKNHITKATNQITIRSEDNQQIGEEWLKSFLNISLMSATSFCSLTGVEQAEMLGIDVSSFDNELNNIKENITELNYKIKAIGDIPEVKEVDIVDVESLLEEEKKIELTLNELYKKNRDENNRRREEHIKLEKDLESNILKWHDECHKRVEAINNCKNAVKTLESHGLDSKQHPSLICFIASLPEPEPEPDTVLPDLVLIDPELPDDTELKEIRKRLSEASFINAEHGKFLDYLKKVEDKKDLEQELLLLKERKKECIESRNNYLSSHDYGFKGLSVDEAGNLQLSVRGEDPRPLKPPYFSRGELELIVSKLHIAINPEFRVRFIDDFEAIDEENQDKILKSLIESDFQVIVAEVGKTSDKENSIVIKEGAIHCEEDERPEIL